MISTPERDIAGDLLEDVRHRMDERLATWAAKLRARRRGAEGDDDLGDVPDVGEVELQRNRHLLLRSHGQDVRDRVERRLKPGRFREVTLKKLSRHIGTPFDDHRCSRHLDEVLTRYREPAVGTERTDLFVDGDAESRTFGRDRPAQSEDDVDRRDERLPGHLHDRDRPVTRRRTESRRPGNLREDDRCDGQDGHDTCKQKTFHEVHPTLFTAGLSHAVRGRFARK